MVKGFVITLITNHHIYRQRVHPQAPTHLRPELNARFLTSHICIGNLVMFAARVLAIFRQHARPVTLRAGAE